MTTGRGGSLIVGPEGLARLGQQVTALGDVNGDGIEDFAVTALRAGNGYETPGADPLDEVGLVYVVYGQAGGLPALLDLEFTAGSQPDGISFSVIQGHQAFGQLGSQLSSAGDLNGDGIDDILIGSPRMNGNAGLVHVIYGQAGGLDPVVDTDALTSGQGVSYSATAANFGNLVSGLGDVNADGFADFLAFSSTDRTGWLVFGDGSDDPPSAVLTAGLADRVLRIDNAGTFGGAVGDLNDDGIADFATRDGSSVVAVHFGSAALHPGTMNLDTHVLTGPNGFAVTAPSAIGGVWQMDDVNGDAVDDLLVTGFSEAWVAFGRPGGFGASLDLATLDGTTGFRMTGAGFVLDAGGIGDVNGDGLRDFVLGTNAGNGTAFLVFGQSGSRDAQLDLLTMTPEQGYRVSGLAAGDAVMGGQLADVNDDGFADWLVPITGLDHSGRMDAGGTAVIYGGPGRLAALDAADGLVDGVMSLAHLDDVLTFSEPEPVPIVEGPVPTVGNDAFIGRAGADVIDLLGGNDRYRGGGGNDRVSGGAGRDLLRGDAGDDLLRGGGGNDRLQGISGRDTLTGDSGDDTLTGGAGADDLSGGIGRDVFVFADGCGRDLIRDFSPAADRLVLDDSLWDGTKTEAQVLADHAALTGGVLVLDFGDGDTIRLLGLTAGDQLVGRIDII